MPRDSAGQYTLPSGNPVVTDTPIQSTWANPTMSDVAAELTNSLDRNGRGGMLAPFLFEDGTAGSPGASWVNEPTSGLFRAGPNDFQLAIATVPRMRFTGGTPEIWDDTDAAWYPVADRSWVLGAGQGYFSRESSDLAIATGTDYALIPTVEVGTYEIQAFIEFQRSAGSGFDNTLQFSVLPGVSGGAVGINCTKYATLIDFAEWDNVTPWSSNLVQAVGFTTAFGAAAVLAINTSSTFVNARVQLMGIVEITQAGSVSWNSGTDPQGLTNWLTVNEGTYISLRRVAL